MAQVITNKHNLPEEIVAAILKDRYTVEGEAESDYSASKLIAPVQQVTLTRRNPDDLLPRDVTHFFFSFIGSIAHAVLEEAWHEGMGSEVERRLYTEVSGKTISGKFDCYQEPEIRDYKNTKAYKIMKNDYLDWEQQQNIYARLLTLEGKKVEKITINAFILDWKEHETFKKGYPKASIVIIPLPLWTTEEQDNFIKTRIDKFIDAENTPTKRLHIKHPCTDREMWRDVKDWAILKEGGSRAVKCFASDDEEGAREHFDTGFKGKPAYSLVRRYTPRTRCLKWCDVAHLCQQNKDLHKEEGIEWPHTKPLF